LAKIISGTQHVSGVIPGMRAGASRDYASGFVGIGTIDESKDAKYIPDLMMSGSIDTIVGHLAATRFGNGATVSMTFQNETAINSTLVFCRAESDEFNFSSNPTYADSTGRLRVIDTGQEGKQLPFSMITTVGLYNEADSLLAVAKLSRPVEKNEEKDITFRVRLDF
jgi:hypothetical protein